MKKLRAFFKGGRKAEPTVSLPDLDTPIDVLTADCIADPYPLYAALRAQKPLAPLASGGFLLTRYEDIHSAFTDRSLGNTPSRFSVLAPKNRDKHAAADLAAQIPPFLDMPAHKMPRQALTRAFHAAFEPFQMRVPDIAAQMVNALPSGRCELVSGLASPFALRVMSEFVGLPNDPARHKAMSQAFFHLFAPLADRAAFEDLNRQLTTAREVIGASLATSESDTLLGHLRAFQVHEPSLSDAQIVDLALLVFADGIENIEAGIATAVHMICRDAIDVPQGDMAATIEEILRLHTPGQIIPRVAQEATELHGVEIGAGMPVFLALGSGNRDSTVFEQAEQFKLGRSETAVTFGRGRHSCIGAALGRVQIEAMVSAILARGVTLAPGQESLAYAPRFGHRWPVAVHTVLA